MIPRGLKNNSE